jgi:N-acetyl-gamma-glutamyl-phosphate reductase
VVALFCSALEPAQETARASVTAVYPQLTGHPGLRDSSSERAGVSASRPVSRSFTPALAPMPRGILATCTAWLAWPGAGSELRDALTAAYQGEPFVHVLARGRWPVTGPTAGSDAAHLQVAADTHVGRTVAVCALDNLGKGAAGQAIQIASPMLGLPETAGLTACGVSQ